MSDLYRNSKRERILHWTHLIATLLLYITGVSWFVPPLGRMLSGYAMVMVIHRVAAAVFIIVPLIMIVTNWKGFVHFLKEMTHWTGSDSKWMMIFPLYVLKYESTKMPPIQGKFNSGQKFNGSMTVGLCTLLAITGLIWIFYPGVSQATMDFLGLAHRIGALILLSMLMGHVFLGSGAFKPYRGMLRTMFSDGKIAKSKAEKIWPAWVEEVEAEKND